MTTTIREHLVSKRYSERDFPAELIKARLLFAASETADFVAPEVVAVDHEQREISYQRVDCGRTLLDVVGSGEHSKDAILGLLWRVGQCLAKIHQTIPPPENVLGHRSELFTKALIARTAFVGPGHDPVLQHGDFGFTNLFVSDAADRGLGPITVIDPSPNGYTSVHALNVDAPELDLAILCSHFLGRSASPLALGRSVAYGQDMITAVMDGYEAVGRAVDRHRLRPFTLASIEAAVGFQSVGSRSHRRAALRPLSSLLARNLP